MVLHLCQRISISLSGESGPRWPSKHRRLSIPKLRLADNQAPGNQAVNNRRHVT
jgi:hypothetical protein